ncbi:MAG: hypothetical protein ACE5JI_17760 [Acidobacteriota bacterium]
MEKEADHPADAHAEQSLIPVIKAEEKRFQSAIQVAREEAARLVRAAEEKAAERVAAAKRQLPEFVSKRRTAMLEQFKSQAESAQRGAELEPEELKEKARGNMDAAVDFIISMVWPRE